MKLTHCDFLTDKNIDVSVVAWLQGRGHEVFDIKEEALFGLTDEEILIRSFEQK